MLIDKAKGRSRVVINDVYPQQDGGRYPVKRLMGESLEVFATLVSDGHDLVAGCLYFRVRGAKKWQETPLIPTGNDRFRASFQLEQNACYEYRIGGWIDHALTWLDALEKKYRDGQDISVHWQDGKANLDHLVSAGKSALSKKVIALQKTGDKDPQKATAEALQGWLGEAFKTHPAKNFESHSRVYEAWCDHPRAGFSSWYEFFPRSAGKDGHGSFSDVERLLPRVAKLGFDVLYLPPVHPIGKINRKGKNNATEAAADDVGSPWGIGSDEGGHKSIHPQLGTISDYRRLIKNARKEYGIEIAMDLAYQCAPDHPYVSEHPQWFKWRSDGTAQYAENPPKKYQDILPIYFETEDWQNLWLELQSVIEHWIDCGIKVFRVDNPHTKSLNFWEWAIAETRKKHPEIIFLSEAFTRPALMHQLAKAGFNQSYTYFTWRNFKHELVEYMEELTHGPGREYFRPNFWPNTPDILPYNLQSGHESLFLQRLFLAGTLSANYGVYGPVYELMEHEAVPGKEEYYRSEKYELREWDWHRENKLTWLMTTLNQARKDHQALQQTFNYRHCPIENENLYAYFKWWEESMVLMVVNLDPYHRQEGMVQLPLDLLNVDGPLHLEMHDVMSGLQYQWSEEWNYVALDPAQPYHLFRITRR